MCDIDNFKSVNDRFGHAAGDLAIISTSEILNSARRSNYLIGRLGGEEFGILLPNANLQMARLLAESLRASIELQALPEPLQNHMLTASFGVASLKHGEDYRQLISRADAALYRAKENGRNCVIIDGCLSTTGNIARAMSA